MNSDLENQTIKPEPGDIEEFVDHTSKEDNETMFKDRKKDSNQLPFSLDDDNDDDMICNEIVVEKWPETLSGNHTGDHDETEEKESVTPSVVPMKSTELESDDKEDKRLLANGQERHRMKKINEALDELRKYIPRHYHLKHRKMSKIRTLRLATSYIATLTDILKETDTSNTSRNESAYSEQTFISPKSESRFSKHYEVLMGTPMTPSIPQYGALKVSPTLMSSWPRDGVVNYTALQTACTDVSPAKLYMYEYQENTGNLQEYSVSPVYPQPIQPVGFPWYGGNASSYTALHSANLTDPHDDQYTDIGRRYQLMTHSDS